MSQSEKKDSPDFSPTECAAMKEREEGECAGPAEIAEMPEAERAITQRIYAITADAPVLMPQLWYGMPAYARDGEVVCFFQSAQKFGSGYATLGFNDTANLNDGAIG